MDFPECQVNGNYKFSVSGILFLQKLYVRETKNDVRETKNDVRETKINVRETKINVRETKINVRHLKTISGI